MIPFNRSAPLGSELKYISAALEQGQVAGDQDYSRRCEQLLQSTLGTKRTLITTSCTHALEMSALLLDIQPGDEVIIPSFTFVSTANAFVLRGARPVFIDVRPDTLNFDESKLEALVTSKTRAVVPVHYAGIACELDAIQRIANQHGLAVVEDNAHGLFGGYRGRPLGTFGALATQSFHETKNFTCGEGGALCINDPALVERAEILREKGTNRARFFRGQVDKYSWVDLGSSYVMSDLLGAFLFGQLECRERIQNNRARIWQTYHTELAEWAERVGARRPVVPAHCDPAWHLYYLLLPDPLARSRFIEHLKSRGVTAVFHYLPLHLSSYAQKRWDGRPGDCPVTEDLSERLVRLPMFNAMTASEQQLVIEAVLDFT